MAQHQTLADNVNYRIEKNCIIVNLVTLEN